MSAQLSSISASSPCDISCGCSFTNAVGYGLQQLGTPNLPLKSERVTTLQAIYNAQDAFIRLPIGFGISICYQAIPFIVDYKTDVFSCRQLHTAFKTRAILVVSPQIALMLDQVMSFKRKGHTASIITSSGGVPKEHLATESNFITDRFLFCTHEVLISTRCRTNLEDLKVGGRVSAVIVVVDEAHCV